MILAISPNGASANSFKNQSFESELEGIPNVSRSCLIADTFVDFSLGLAVGLNLSTGMVAKVFKNQSLEIELWEIPIAFRSFFITAVGSAASTMDGAGVTATVAAGTGGGGAVAKVGLGVTSTTGAAVGGLYVND